MKMHSRLLFIALLLGLVSWNGVASAEEKAAESDKQAETPKPDADGWYSLFNGKDFSGWKKSEDNPDTFQVVDGEIVVKGPRSHLYYVGPVNGGKFKNFEWKCEILTKPNANSGMYFHSEYQKEGWPKKGLEVQINNTHGDPRKTGSLYRAKDIMNDSPAKDNEWFTQHVIVKGRHVTVKVNDKVVNEFTESKTPAREAGWEGNVVARGTFALQGHDPDSEVHFRKIMVKPLPGKKGKGKKGERKAAKAKKTEKAA
jgi:Domain of Unknown Function (DUF1080)